MPAFTHLNNGCDCQSCDAPKKDAPQLSRRTKGFSPGAATHITANGIAFAARLGKSPQAIDASGPSSAAGGQALSAKQGQQRQCVSLGAAHREPECMQCHHRG
jgi:hypothetical protein